LNLGIILVNRNVRQDFQQSLMRSLGIKLKFKSPSTTHQLTFVKQAIINLGSKTFANPTLPARRYLCRGTTKLRLSLSAHLSAGSYVYFFVAVATPQPLY